MGRLGERRVAEIFAEAHEKVQNREPITAAEARKRLALQAERCEDEEWEWDENDYWDEDEEGEWNEEYEEEEEYGDEEIEDDGGGEVGPASKRQRTDDNAPKKIVLLRAKQ